MMIKVPMNINPDLLDEQIEFLAGLDMQDDQEYKLIDGILGILEALSDEVEMKRKFESDAMIQARYEEEYDDKEVKP